MKHFLSNLLVFLLIVSAAGLSLPGCGSKSAEIVTEPFTAQATPTDVVFSTDPADPTIPAEIPMPPETSISVPVCPLPLDDWRLQLVNRDHPSNPENKPNLTYVRSGIYVDSRCYADLIAMLKACQSEGLRPLVCSGYRDLDEQTRLFENKVRRLRAEGMTKEDASLAAQTVVALPGTSEHHIGLAVDIVDQSYQLLNERQEQTAVQQWLIEHCWEYGFILRYPKGKSDITSIIYEPWHYRYVGREIAAEIRSSGLCLEEYLAQFMS